MQALRSSGRLLGGATLSVLLSACAASAPPLKPTALPKEAAAPPAPVPPKERLLGALRQVARPEPVLSLLPAEAVAVLDARLKALTPEQREQVLSPELSRSVPLLHLKAGGSAKEALVALATTPAAAQELPLVFESAPQDAEDARRRRVQLANDVVQRAAKHFLRDRVLDVANASPQQLPAVLSDIVRLASAAGLHEIERLALETWVGNGAPAEMLARLGEACAFDNDEKCFAQALSGVPEAAPEHARLVLLDKALKQQNDGDLVVKAWALLRLGRFTEAQQAILPLASKAKYDLRIAAAIAVAVSEGSSCPGISMPAAASPRQCADAVTVRPGLAAANADMDLAWQSGAGRDAAASEAYVGLAHVVPWTTFTALAPDAAALERDFSARYAALSRVLAELPEQKAFGVFASALAAGVSASFHSPHGARPVLESSMKQELWFGALGVDAPAPRLAVGAVLATDQPVLTLLPKAAPPALAQARAGLLAWEAANGGDAETLEAARAALSELLLQSPKGSLDAAAAVLLLAELDALSAPSERTQRALAQVSSQLIGEPLPPELALRAVLDAAGALERLGRTADALGVLTKAAEIQAPPGPAAELLSLIRAEKLALEWDPKKDKDRAALAKAIGNLPASSAPPAISFLLGAYASPKVLRAPGAKQTPKAILQERIGVRPTEQLSKGAFCGGRASLRVSYSFLEGLRPEVRFEPMLVPLVRPELIQKAL